MAAEKITVNKTVQYVLDQFKRSEDFYGDKKNRISQDEERWKGTPPPAPAGFEHGHRIHLKLTWKAEKVLTSRIHSTLFPVEAPIDYEATGSEDEPLADGTKEMVRLYFKKAEVKSKSKPVIRQIVLHGTGMAEVSLKIKKQLVYEKGAEIKGEGIDTIVYDGPTFEFMDIREAFPDPNMREITDSYPFIRRRFMSLTDLEVTETEAQSKGYSKFQNLAKLREGLNKEKVKVEQDAIARREKSETTKGDDIEIIEMWHPYWDYKGKKRPCWIMIANRQYELFTRSNPYWHQTPPYVKTVLFEDGTFFGIGIAQAGESHEDLANELTNQRLDNVSIVINRQVKYDANDPKIDVRKLRVSKPGGIHACSNPQTSIIWDAPPDVTQSSYIEVRDAVEHHREITGATTPIQAVSPAEQHKTASGMAMLIRTASERLKINLSEIEYNLIIRTADLFCAILYQFKDTDEIIRIIWDEGKKKPVTVSPKDLLRELDFRATGMSETIAKELQIAQLLRFLEITRDDPTINRKEANKRLLYLMDIKDPEGLVQEPPPTGGQAIRGISPEEGNQIRERVGAGVSPRQIKAEIGAPAGPKQEQLFGR